MAPKETSSIIVDRTESPSVTIQGRAKGVSSGAETTPEVHTTGGRGPLAIQMPVDGNLLAQARLLAGDRNVRIDDLATLISQDPVLTLELLRFANAIAFTQDRPPITTAKMALVRLGSAHIVEILNDAGLRKPFTDPAISTEFENLRILGRRISIVARIVAMTTNQDLADEAHTVGLMSTIGQMVACAYLGKRYVDLVQSMSSKSLAYKIANEYNFDIRSVRLNYLRQHGLPESLVFAFDRDLAPKTPERVYLRVIGDAATELVEAFDHNKWEKYQEFKSLPSQSALRIFQLTEPIYYRLYDRVEEYLTFTKEEAEKKKQDQVKADEPAAAEAKPMTTPPSLNKESQDVKTEHDGAAPNALNAKPTSTPAAPTAPAATLPKSVVPEKAAVSTGIWDAVAPVFVTVEQVDLQNPPRLYSQKATEVVAEVCGLCTDAESAEDLLEQLLQTLTNTGPFIRAALITLASDKRSASVHVAVGEGIKSGATIVLSDPLSPLAACLPQVRSFNALNLPRNATPLGVSSFAVSPIRVENDTPVFLYADCGSVDSLTFEARRIFRYVVGLLNQVLPSLPGGLP